MRRNEEEHAHQNVRERELPVGEFGAGRYRESEFTTLAAPLLPGLLEVMMVDCLTPRTLLRTRVSPAHFDEMRPRLIFGHFADLIDVYGRGAGLEPVTLGHVRTFG